MMKKIYGFFPLILTLAGLIYFVATANETTNRLPTAAADLPVTATPNLDSLPFRQESFPSPDGRWFADITIAGPAQDESRGTYYQLTLRRADGERIWQVFEEWEQTQVSISPQPFANFFLWTQDGHGFYYIKRQAEQCHLDTLKYDLPRSDYGYGLYRVDLESGELSEISSCMLSLPAYSPDKSAIAYLEDDQIVLLETNSAQKHTWSFPSELDQENGIVVRYLTWSPDNKAVLVPFLITSLDTRTQNWKSSALIIDRVSLSIIPVEVPGEERVEATGWKGPGLLAVTNPRGDRWLWERESRTLTRVVVPTATPIVWPGMPTPDLNNTAEWRVGRQSFASPDGRWTGETIIAFSKDETKGIMYTGLVVRRADGKKEWWLVDEWAMAGEGWSSPRPFHWSKDGRKFYYTNWLAGDCILLVRERGLHEVDLESGMVKEIGGIGPRLSPDERSVAYIRPEHEQTVLVIHDLASGQERAIPIHEDYISALIVWSPDSKFLAVTKRSGCDSVEEGPPTSILLVDATTLEVTPLLENDRHYRIAEEWPEPDRLLLRDFQGQWWQLDPTTRTLLPTQAPTPAASPIPACQPTSTPTPTPSD